MPFKRVLSKSADWRASKALDFVEIQSLEKPSSFDSSPWLHWWLIVLPVQVCLFWIWNITLVHFSFNNASSFLQVAQAYQKWLQIDFSHGFNSSHVFLFEAFNNFVLMDLLKCLASNWWLICSFCLHIYFLIWSWRFVVKRLILWSFPFNSCSVLIRPAFSILVELATSVTCVNEIATTFFWIWSYREYVKYFELWPSLS